MYTVLVCDDDKAILDALEIYLKLEGYNVLKAENGEEALKLASENEIHCMILDIMMPGMDGPSAETRNQKYSHHPAFVKQEPIRLRDCPSEPTTM